MRRLSNEELKNLQRGGAKVKRKMGLADEAKKPTTEKAKVPPKDSGVEKRLAQMEERYAESQKALLNSMHAVSILEQTVKTLQSKDADTAAVDVQLQMVAALKTLAKQKVTVDRVPWEFEIERHHNGGLISKVVAKPQEK